MTDDHLMRLRPLKRRELFERGLWYGLGRDLARVVIKRIFG